MKKIIFIFCIILLVFSKHTTEKPSGYEILNYGGKNILITFAGWSVKLEWAKNWSKNILKAKKLNNYNLIAVKGPNDVFFKNKDDISITLLVDELKNNFSLVDTIVVVAHSSGSYVAHNFFNELIKSDAAKNFKKKIIYYNLDGGIGDSVKNTYLTEDVASYLNKIYAVYVYDKYSNIYSPNYKEMQEISKTYSNTKEIKLVPDFQICNQNAKWCLHDYLINLYPFNKDKFDLEKDYYWITPELTNVEYLNIIK